MIELGPDSATLRPPQASQHAVGGEEVASLREAELAAQAILENAPETFDAAFGLRGLRSDESDAALREGAAELGGLSLAGEFFLDRPVGIVSDEDAAAVAVEGGGDAEAAEQALEQVEIAFGGFRKEELGRKDFAGGIVVHAESGEARAAACEPVVGAAVELEECAFASRTQTALAMSRGEASRGRRCAEGGEEFRD